MRVRSAIETAIFTGKGDKAKVVRMYNQYITGISNAIARSGEVVGSTWSGQQNAAGQREGRGILRTASGNVFEGTFRAGQMEGRGTCRFFNGDVYEGDHKADQMEGPGTADRTREC